MAGKTVKISLSDLRKYWRAVKEEFRRDETRFVITEYGDPVAVLVGFGAYQEVTKDKLRRDDIPNWKPLDT